MATRGAYAKGRERRSEILAVVGDVLAEKGYRRTSLRAIGDAVGIEPAHILYYFGTREKLLEAVIEAWDEGTRATMAEHVDPLGGWVAATRHNLEVPGLLHLYTAFAAEASDPSHPSHAFIRDRYRRVIGNMTDRLARHAERGTLAPGLDAGSASLRLIALVEGLQLQWLVDPSLDLVGELQRAIDDVVPGRNVAAQP